MLVPCVCVIFKSNFFFKKNKNLFIMFTWNIIVLIMIEKKIFNHQKNKKNI